MKGFPTHWTTLQRMIFLQAMQGGGGGEILSVTGLSPLLLENALAHAMVSLTQYGKCEQRNLPQGYTQVEYISSDGTNYIDLGVGVDQDDEIEVVFRLTQSGQTSRQIFGYRASASQNNCTVFIGGSGNIVIDFNNSDYATYRAITASAYTANTVYRAVISKARRALYAGDTLVVENTVACPDTITIPDVYAMRAGGAPTSSNGIIGDLISVSIKGKVNGIAAKQNSDSAYGICDTVADSFHTDASEGDFTGGNAVTASPATPMSVWCNNGVLRFGKPLTIDPTRYYAYISTSNTWGYSTDSYSIVVPVTVGKKYKITADPTTPIGGVGNTILRWGFVDTIYDDWKQTAEPVVSTPITIYDWVRSTPQDTQSVEVTATHPYMVVQMGAAIFADNLANGRIGVAVQEVYGGGTNGFKNLLDPSQKWEFRSYRWLWYNTGFEGLGFQFKANTPYTFSVQASGVSVGIASLDGSTTYANGDDSVCTFTPTEDCVGYLTASGVVDLPEGMTAQLEIGSSPTSYEPFGYAPNGLREVLTITAAGAETQTVNDVSDLLAIPGTDYADTQEIINGPVGHKVLCVVMDGVTAGRKLSESWNATYKRGNLSVSGMLQSASNVEDAMCTRFDYSASVYGAPTKDGFCTNSGVVFFTFIEDSDVNSAADGNAKFAAWYAEGNPAMLFVPLAEPTTETVTAQPLNTHNGTNVVEVVSNVDPVTLTVEYKGVSA